MAAQRAGLGAPAFNMYCADASMYRFLFAGVVMFVGCMMPFSAELGRAGYQSLAGGFYLLIATALIWSWWGSIANNRASGVKWVLAASLPLIITIMKLVAFDATAEFEVASKLGWVNSEMTYSASLSEALGDMWKGRQLPDAAMKADGYWRLMGPGNVFILLGSVIAEAGLIFGLTGGMKQNKKAKQEKRAQAAERKRK
jgi:hypothetical protein